MGTFLRDLHMAAQDLRTNGLNLDSLREEIGNDKREPLPLAPPLKGTPREQPEDEEGAMVVNPRASGSALQQKPDEAAPVSSEASVPPQPKEPRLKEQTNNWVGAAGDFLAQQTAKVSPAPNHELLVKRAERSKKSAERWEREAAAQAARCASLDARLTAAARRQGAEKAELARLRDAATRREEVAFQTQRERDACAAELEAVALRRVDALQAEVAGLKREKKRADQLERDLDKLKVEVTQKADDRSAGEKAERDVRSLTLRLDAARSASAAAARAARSEVDLRKRKADDADKEAARLRLELRETRAIVGKLEAERDAFRRERDRVEDVARRRAKRQDDADGLRAMLKEALEGRTAAEVQLADEKQKRVEAETAKNDAQRKAAADAKAWAGELQAARQAARDARTALVERRVGPAAAVSSSSSLGLADHHNNHHTNGPDDPATYVDDSEVGPGDSASHRGGDDSDVSEAASLIQPGGSGAAEYLKSVVVAALPNSSSSACENNNNLFAAGGLQTTSKPTAVTRARLVPVLRSLLALPHETVASSLEALATTNAGGDFALALVAAASGAAAASQRAKRIVSRADAGQMREERVKRLDLERDLRDAKDAAEKLTADLAEEKESFTQRYGALKRDLDAEVDAKQKAVAACEADARKLREDTRQTLAAYEADMKRAIDASLEVDAKCADLVVKAAEAEDDARAALAQQAAFQAKVEALLNERKLGLDEAQLDYLRATLATVLRGFQNHKLRAQLLPVLVNILKLEHHDPRAKELLDIADPSSDEY